MSALRDGLLKQCDCPADRWAKCPHGWTVAKRINGKMRWKSLDKEARKRGLPLPRLRGDAEKLADVVVGELETGTYHADAHRGAPLPVADPHTGAPLTFTAAAAAYVETIVEPSDVDRATVKQFEARFRRLGSVSVPDVGVVGMATLASLTTAVVGACYRLATKGMANSTKHKYGQALKGLFDWAVTQGHLARTPVTKEAKVTAGADAMRTRRVYRDEEENLLQAASETQATAGARLVALLILALDLGLRLGELLALKWGDILWVERRVIVRAVERGARKGGEGKSRPVPMTARVEAVLKRLNVGPTGQPWSTTAYVLGDTTGGRITNVRKAWVTCVLRAANHEPVWIKDGKNKLAPESRARFQALNLHIHDLRHECALRWHQEKHYSLGTIAALLGHADLATLRVYLGLAQHDALREAEAVNAAIEAAEGPAASKTLVNAAPARLRVVRRKEARAS